MILLHFGVVTFGFHFGKIRTVIIFMIFGPRGNVHDPQNQLFLALDTLNYYNKRKELPRDLKYSICGNRRI